MSAVGYLTEENFLVERVGKNSPLCASSLITNNVPTHL